MAKIFKQLREFDDLYKNLTSVSVEVIYPKELEPRDGRLLESLACGQGGFADRPLSRPGAGKSCEKYRFTGSETRHAIDCAEEFYAKASRKLSLRQGPPGEAANGKLFEIIVSAELQEATTGTVSE